MKKKNHIIWDIIKQTIKFSPWRYPYPYRSELETKKRAIQAPGESVLGQSERSLS